MRIKINYILFLYFLITFTSKSFAQNNNFSTADSLINRVKPAPLAVFEKFRQADINPINHILTSSEKKKLTAALSELPPLHQKILKQHLHSISFMDNMPNTALTSPVESEGNNRMFNIVVRAEILHETISQWATWKERSYYIIPQNSFYSLCIDGGNLNAILYVLLHEATHVVDAVMGLTPHILNGDHKKIASTEFTKDVWDELNLPAIHLRDSLLETTRFRSGKTLPISSSAEIYEALKATPFVSLYSMASWHEDLAEQLSIYHLTVKMKQPYKVVILKNKTVEMIYEPSKNTAVQNRQDQLSIFYQ